MNVSEEEENFFRVTRLVYREIPTQLRKFFKAKWDQTFPQELWDNTDIGSGTRLWKKIDEKKFHVHDTMKGQIQSGDCDSWDMSTVCAVILKADLGLIKKPRSKALQQGILLESENIERLRDVRNERLCHLSDCSLPSDKAKEIFEDVRDIYDDLKWSKNQLDKIETEILTTEEVRKLKLQIEKEKNEGFHNLPSDIKNYVGREKEMGKLLNAVEEPGDSANLVLIHGGPCYGKSAFTTRFGYEMLNNGYNYVIWIDVGQVYPVNDSNDPPSDDKLAKRILHEFRMDCPDKADQANKHLKSKFRSIKENGKRAVVILDNADILIEYQSPETSQGAYRMIQEIASPSTKFVLTSRSSEVMDVTKVEINRLTDEESKRYVDASLKNETLMDRDTLIKRITKYSIGMPLALKILTYEVNSADDGDYLKEYLDDVERQPLQTLDDQVHPIIRLFETSFKHLKNEELQLMKVLAVFPGAFSYKYVQKFSQQFGSKATIIKNIRQKGLLERYNENYHIHPLLLEFTRKFFKWNEEKKEEKDEYQAGFIKVYVESLFQLGWESLEKDRYSECFNEFKKEKHNFLYLMELLNQDEIMKKEWIIFNRGSEDYIAMMLFTVDLVYARTLITFFKSCEILASKEYRYRVWSCQFELYKKLLETSIEKNDEFDNVDQGVDDYCSILLERRRLADEAYVKAFSAERNELISQLQSFVDKVKQLPNKKIASYFHHKACKLLGHVHKKIAKKKKANYYYEEALKICNDSVGQHIHTYDGYIQLAKFHWKFQEYGKANENFEKANELAEIMKISDVKIYSSYLLGHGRCLIDSNEPENVDKGAILLEKSLKSCDNTHSMYFCSALDYLLRVDSCHSDKVIPYLYTLENPGFNILQLVTKCFKNDAKELKKASHFVAEIYEKNQRLCSESFYQLQSLITWDNRLKELLGDEVVDVNHAETRMADFAEKALKVCSEDSGIYEWHYKILVDHLPSLFSSSAFDGINPHPGIEIGLKVLALLKSKRNRVFEKYKRDKLKFEILYIMALQTEGKMDVEERKKLARSAFALFKFRNKDELMAEKHNELKHFFDTL